MYPPHSTPLHHLSFVGTNKAHMAYREYNRVESKKNYLISR
jgi:hypothetical protein